MKKLLTLLALFVGFVSPAFAQVTLTFDENGNSNPTFFFTVATDPLSGVATLEYVLLHLQFPSVTTGDLHLTEPGTGDSDLFRFEQPNGPGTNVDLFVYSLTDDGVDSLADTVASLPPPGGFQANLLTLAETGPEAGPNGIFYTPTAGEPGFGSVQNYNFISDVPEPSTTALAGFGALITLIGARRLRSVRLA